MGLSRAIHSVRSLAHLAVIHDELGDSDRAALHAALDASEDEFRAGKGIPAAEVSAELRRR